jgi:two-component system nitrate/nitrite response regulator NarL
MTIGAVLIALLSPLLRDALAQILLDAGATMIREAANLDDALSCLRSIENDHVDLVIMDAELCNGHANAVRSIRQAGGQARIVILGYDINAISSDQALAADGVLTFDITADMMIRSLRLIQTGERVVPRELMQVIVARSRQSLSQSAVPQRASRLRGNQAPSPREAEILQRLLQGYSNKTIARELGITEPTVKVHLKSLLRKIDASNRTQAAIWALNNGYRADVPALATTVSSVPESDAQPPTAIRLRPPRCV